ncbi:hypothetical protein IX329_000707 [Fusobacterium necrophorum]|nr:DUF4116 domain-containing protein [Fusobacterium necrophorum]MBR8733134.1 hypothetical protein [Fusobacterium necrophorum]MBR8789322.1 hypothetical protein [Fusobacterium necrophorum]
MKNENLAKEIFLEKIKNSHTEPTSDEKELLKNRDFLIEVLKINTSVFRFTEQFQNDKEIVRAVIKQDIAAKRGIGLLKFASEEIRADKDFMLEMLSLDNWALDKASDELKDDKEFVLQAMKGKYAIPLDFASLRLRKDKDVVLENISNEILRTMQYKLKCDIENKEQKRELIKQNIESILLKKYDDKDILKAVEETQKYENLEEILKKVKGDFTNPFKEEKIKEILKKIEEKPSLLEYADEEIKNDKKVILSAIKKAWYVFRFASKQLRADREVVLAAIEENALNLQYASEELRDDKEIVIKAVRKIGSSINYASERLKNDKEVVMEAIKSGDNLALWLAGEKLKNDKSFVIEAIKYNPDTLFGASKELQEDKDVLEYISSKKKY